MWICRLYKQSGSLRPATVISKAADGSELRGPFLQHNRAWTHCHPGTFLLSLHSRTFEIHPDHQSESSWVGKRNGYPYVLFPRESAFCQMLRGWVSKVFNRFTFLLPGVPFCTAEGTGGTFESGLYGVALGTQTTQFHWVQNWLKPDLLIFAAHECVCMCVCSCTCTHVCTFGVDLLCCLPWISFAPACPHLCPYLQWNHLLLLSVQRWWRDSDHCLPPSCLLGLVHGWTRGFIQATEHIGTFDGTVE